VFIKYYGATFTNLSYLPGVFYAAILQHLIFGRPYEGILFFIFCFIIIFGIIIYSLEDPINSNLSEIQNQELENKLENISLITYKDGKTGS